jgi:hypothetical protein
VIGELTTADIVTMSRHVQIGRVAAYLNVTWPIPYLGARGAAREV